LGATKPEPFLGKSSTVGQEPGPDGWKLVSFQCWRHASWERHLQMSSAQPMAGPTWESERMAPEKTWRLWKQTGRPVGRGPRSVFHCLEHQDNIPARCLSSVGLCTRTSWAPDGHLDGGGRCHMRALDLSHPLPLCMDWRVVAPPLIPSWSGRINEEGRAGWVERSRHGHSKSPLVRN
jgi:hypothetical protein